MLSIEYIQEEAKKKGREAKRRGIEPFVYDSVSQVEELIPFPFPFLGDYVPKDWNRTYEWFVDSSGFGERGEAALTVDQFIRKAQDSISSRRGVIGFAITQAGQFQVYVGLYERAGTWGLTAAERSIFTGKNS